MDNLSDAADLGRGRISEPNQPGNRPALEIGFPAMLDLYQKYNIPITHFIEGWNGAAHPEEIQRLLSHGHEIGMHGWQHEQWSELDDERVFELAVTASDALEKSAGVRPTAFRAPGGATTEFTREILSSLGYHIDASLNPDGKEGGAISQITESLWSVPYEWNAVDATHWLWNDISTKNVEKLWIELLDSAAKKNNSIVFIWHPHVMGIDAERLAVGETILQLVTASTQFQVLTLTELLEHIQSP